MNNSEFMNLMMSKTDSVTFSHLDQLQIMLRNNALEAYEKLVDETRAEWESGESYCISPDTVIWSVPVYGHKRSEDSAEEYEAFAKCLEERLKCLTEKIFFEAISKLEAEKIVESLGTLSDYNFLSAKIDFGCGLTYNELTFVSTYNQYNPNDKISDEKFFPDY